MRLHAESGRTLHAETQVKTNAEPKHKPRPQCPYEVDLGLNIDIGQRKLSNKWEGPSAKRTSRSLLRRKNNFPRDRQCLLMARSDVPITKRNATLEFSKTTKRLAHGIASRHRSSTLRGLLIRLHFFETFVQFKVIARMTKLVHTFCVFCAFHVVSLHVNPIRVFTHCGKQTCSPTASLCPVSTWNLGLLCLFVSLFFVVWWVGTSLEKPQQSHKI